MDGHVAPRQYALGQCAPGHYATGHYAAGHYTTGHYAARHCATKTICHLRQYAQDYMPRTIGTIKRERGLTRPSNPVKGLVQLHHMMMVWMSDYLICFWIMLVSLRLTEPLYLLSNKDI